MATFALKVKTKLGQEVVRSLTPESTISELKTILANISNIPASRLNVLSGFPPKTLDLSGGSSSLKSSGITSGDTLILEEKTTGNDAITITPSNVTTASGLDVNNTTADELYMSQTYSDCPGILMKHTVPSDNSCLFMSIHFVLNAKTDETESVAPWMRQLIAETVEREPESYSEAILGKPPSEYCAWIKDDKSWGGAIELAVLSNYYGIEIAVADTINGIINRFGEDQNYGNRVFLLFDGIHYDPLYLEPADGGPIKTIFPSNETRWLDDAENLAKEAKSSRQFTDVQAQEHAHSTGHTSFGEI